MSTGRYLGFGVDKYTAVSLPALEFPVRDVEALCGLLVSFEADAVTDPDEVVVRGHLKALKGSVEDSSHSLVVHWAGHGALSQAVPLRLLAKDNDPDKDEGLDIIGDLASASAQSGANQILIIVDTCYSGKAVSAGEVVASVIQARASDEHEYLWVGVLTSCMPVETARDGLFGSKLLELLKYGPTNPDMKVRWSTQNRMIRGHDLCEALLVDWGGAAQKPSYNGDGISYWMFPNPLYRPGAPEEVVEHLLLAARGGSSSSARSWFTGRAAEVDRVVAWVRSGVAGMHVVTGSAGTGKSAIVGRVVSLSNPQERERLVGEGGEWVHADPGERSVHAHIHVRGLTADRAADLLGAELERCGHLEHQGARRNASELVGQVQRVVAEGKPPPVIVVDGLDEARGAAFSLAEDLLGRLSEYAVVVVSTRELQRSDQRGSLIATLAPHGAELDLDEPAVQASGRRDMHEYIATRLSDVSDSMDPQAVADHLNRETSLAESPFLLARLVTDRLVEHAIDTSISGWEQLVSGSIGDALEEDIARLVPPVTSEAAAGAPWVEIARGFLTALTWGLGAGLPEEEWLAVARATVMGGEYDSGTVAWALDQLGRYIVQDGQDGVAVYRLVHQSLADHLRPAFSGSYNSPFDPNALPVARALLDHYAKLLARGMDARGPLYLWRYAWRHAAVAGQEGLGLLRDMAGENDLLVPDIALASMLVADTLVEVGRGTEAVAFTEEAVEVLRVYTDEDATQRSRLAGALNNLGNRYSEVGRYQDAVQLLEDAVEIYRGLVDDNSAALPYLAGALSNLGVHYRQVGRTSDAIDIAKEVVELYRVMAQENPVFLQYLAGSLAALGNNFSDIGKPHEGLAVTREAVDLYRSLADENPAFLSNFASAINNLGNRYSDVGRFRESLAQAEEAVVLFRALAEENPGFVVDVAAGLKNLGASYVHIGHPQQALPVAQEALKLYRDLAAENRMHEVGLAGALSLFGSALNAVGRLQDAVAPTEEAVALYRKLAAENPARLGELAGSLNNLSSYYTDQGRVKDGIALVEESVSVLRGLANDNPAFVGDLTMAVGNLGNRYGESGRYEEAVELLEESVELCRNLAAENPRFLDNLASAHNSLGSWYAEEGLGEKGVAETEEALAIYRELAETEQWYRGDLASTLNNLSRHFSKLERREEAIAPAEEAVEIYQSLAMDNPGFLGSLSAALNNLGSAYGQAHRAADAEPVLIAAIEAAREAVKESQAHVKDLAVALSNLSRCYGDLERAPEGVPYAQEAVALYRALTAENKVFVRDLAGTLRNFTIVASPELSDPVWDETIDTSARELKPTLIFVRASIVAPGTPHVPEWLVDATEVAAEYGLPLIGLHEQARRHRLVAPEEFDREWVRLTGSPTPPWLTVEEDLVLAARAWTQTRSYEEEQDYLMEHPVLLDARADQAVEAVLVDHPAEMAEHFRRVRSIAREQGVAAAYLPIHQMLLAVEFVSSDIAGQRRLLADRRAELLDPAVIALVVRGATEAETQSGGHAGALLALAAAEEDAGVLDAIEEPSRFASLLAERAAQASPTLGALAVVAMLAAVSAAERADAAFYLAVASNFAGQAETALSALAFARENDSGRVEKWIGELAKLAKDHPSAVELISALTEQQALQRVDAQRNEEHDGED